MILRVDPSPQVYAAGLALGWPTAFFQVPQTQEPAEAVAEAAPAPMDATPRQGSGSGHPASPEMVTVRRLLTDRAENGQADAAYELALTYDVEVLARAGIETIEGDMVTARAWYMRAAQAGHAGATRRLEMIARRPAGA
jgi:TPR repeat protein